MIGDNFIIAFLIGFPFVVLGLAATILFFSRRRTMQECPQCLHQIPKDTFTYQVPCPECEAVFVGVTEPYDSSSAACCKCSGSHDCTFLWDGKSYCRVCIDEQNPRLFDVAKTAVLAEEVPYSSKAVALRMFLLAVLAIGGFALVIGGFAASVEDWEWGIQAFAVIFLIGSPVVLMFTVGAFAALPLLRMKALAWNGQLIIRFGTKLIIAPLSECIWSEGDVSQMTVWQYGILLRGPALVVELPKKAVQGGNRFPVGFTPETRQIWQAFFTLADIPRKPAKTGWWTNSAIQT